MSHRRSPSKMGEGRALVVEGAVCRESNHVALLVNKRWMQLWGPGPGGEPPMLASFRHEGDVEPSKHWQAGAGQGCLVCGGARLAALSGCAAPGCLREWSTARRAVRLPLRC